MKAAEKRKRIAEVVRYMQDNGLATTPDHVRDVYRRLIDAYTHCGIGLEEVLEFLKGNKGEKA